MEKRGKRLKFRAKGSIYALIYAMVLGLCLIWVIQAKYYDWAIYASEFEINKGKVQTISRAVGDLSEENTALREKLEASSKIATPAEVKKLSEYYIRKYFGADADRVIKVMTCESNLNNLAVHVNKEGLGKDLGLYQLNDRWHKARFEKMYGIPFEVGALDFDISSRYAKFMFDNSKNLSAWVCSRIVE